jgi:hypothetical protein
MGFQPFRKSSRKMEKKKLYNVLSVKVLLKRAFMEFLWGFGSAVQSTERCCG